MNVFPGKKSFSSQEDFLLSVLASLGRVINIQGRSNNNASRFEINLLTSTYGGGDVAFHFNPRFDQREAVRNSCHGGGWGAEEKQGGFPLQPGQPFDIQIICFPEHYQVRTN